MKKQNSYINEIMNYLDENDWSLAYISKKAGLHSSALAEMIRRNSIPRIVTLAKICNALNISMSEFIRRVEENKES